MKLDIRDIIETLLSKNKVLILQDLYKESANVMNVLECNSETKHRIRSRLNSLVQQKTIKRIGKGRYART